MAYCCHLRNASKTITTLQHPFEFYESRELIGSHWYPPPFLLLLAVPSDMQSSLSSLSTIT